jgi:hypothetical protein
MAEEITISEDRPTSGFDEYDPMPDEPYYAKAIKNGESWVATQPYCPVCSKTLSYDRNSNRVRTKWSLDKKDYVFDLRYEFDEESETKYVVCNKCRYDFRNPVQEARERYGSATKRKPVKKKSRFEADQLLSTNIEFIKDGTFADGFFLMTVDEFKRVITKSYETKGGITPIISYGGTKYTITIPQMMTFYKEIEQENETLVGIPRIYWKQTAL